MSFSAIAVLVDVLESNAGDISPFRHVRHDDPLARYEPVKHLNQRAGHYAVSYRDATRVRVSFEDEQCGGAVGL